MVSQREKPLDWQKPKQLLIFSGVAFFLSIMSPLVVSIFNQPLGTALCFIFFIAFGYNIAKFQYFICPNCSKHFFCGEGFSKLFPLFRLSCGNCGTKFGSIFGTKLN